MIIEYPDVSAFAVSPGLVETDLTKNAAFPEDIFTETPELVSATTLALTSGKYDWLSGR